MKPLTVALLFGGQSNEHAVSCRSALTVFNALQAGGYALLPIGITQKGEWLLLRADQKSLQTRTGKTPPICTPSRWHPTGGSARTGDGHIARTSPSPFCTDRAARTERCKASSTVGGYRTSAAGWKHPPSQ